MKKKKSLFQEMAKGVEAPKPPSEVTIRKADNGFVISTYGEHGPMTKIAKDMDEAMVCAKECLK